MTVDFNSIADYYDLIYSGESACKKECEQVRELVNKYNRSGNTALLDIACGTGAQSLFLSEHFDVTGIDLSGEMLRIAKEKVKNARFLLADMTNFQFKEKFGAAVNLFGSIGFARGKEQMEASIACTYACLSRGGVFLLTPWGTKEEFREEIVAGSGKTAKRCFCRMEHIKRAGEDLVQVEMIHLIGQDGQITEYRQTQDICLWSENEYGSALRKAGFKIKERLSAQQFRMGAFLCTKE